MRVRWDRTECTARTRCRQRKRPELLTEKGFPNLLPPVESPHTQSLKEKPLTQGTAMAKFLERWKNRVETYKDKAEEIQALIQEGAETIRDIRSDVESTVEDLKADSEEKMMEYYHDYN